MKEVLKKVMHAKILDHAHLIKTTPIFIALSTVYKYCACARAWDVVMVIVWCALFETGEGKQSLSMHEHKAN